MDMASLLLVLPGFFLGALIWSRVVRWIYSIVTVNKEQQRDPTHRSKWRFVPVILLHSGPWTLIAFVGLAVYILPRPHDPAWEGFFWGALAALIFMVFNMVLVLRRFRKARDERIAQAQKPV